MDDHETGQVLVFAAQSVQQPRSHARAGEDLFPRVHLEAGIRMVDVVRHRRADHADVVNARSEVRQEITYLDAGPAVLREFERASGLQLNPRPLLDFVAEPIDTAFGQHILQSRVFAVGAIAEIPMDGYHSLGYGLEILRRKKSNHIGDPGERLRVAMRHAQAAASQ